jgi:hypothetical protein
MGTEQLFNQDFSSIQALPTTDQQFAINQPYTRSPLTLSTITTTASFDPTPPSKAKEVTPVSEHVTRSLIELSDVFTIVNFAPSQSNESTELERRTYTEEGLDGMFPEDQSAISPEKDQTAPQPVKGPTLTDPHTTTLVTNPEAMNTGDDKSTSGNVTAAKDENHPSTVEHDVAHNFDVTGEHRRDDPNPVASSPTAKKSLSTKASRSRRSQIIIDTNDGNPIVIDSDDETSGEQHAPPSPNRIKRARAEGPGGLVLWADPKFEDDLRRKASDLFEKIQASWMQVRDLPQLAGMLTVERFNLTIIEIEKMENQAVSQEDAILLRDLFEEMDTERLSTVTGKDGRLVRKLRKRIRDLPEKTFMTDMVEEYQGKDDDQDSDYRPVKRRRSG